PAQRYSLSFFFVRSRHLLDLPSFPTRRSSDLVILNALNAQILGLEERGQGILRLPRVGQGQLGPTHLGQAQLHVRVETARFEIQDRKSTRLNSSHVKISYAVFCLKKKKIYKI